MKNEMTLAFDSISENEEFARVTVAAFASQLNPWRKWRISELRYRKR